MLVLLGLQAVQKFLVDMGLNMQELKNNQELVDAIVSYHMLPGYKISKGDVFKLGDKVPVYGGHGRPYSILVSKIAGDHAEATDIQGNVARSVRTFGAGNHVVHVMDKLLYSGARAVEMCTC